MLSFPPPHKFIYRGTLRSGLRQFVVGSITARPPVQFGNATGRVQARFQYLDQNQILTKKLGHIAAEQATAVQLLQSLGMVYATDFWESDTLRPAPVNNTLLRIRSHMARHNVRVSHMRPVLTHILSLFEHYLYDSVYEVLRLCATTVGDSPRVRELWGKKSGA